MLTNFTSLHTCEVSPLGPGDGASRGPLGAVEKTLFLHLGWSSRVGEDGSELRTGAEGRDMCTPVQLFINCLNLRGVVAWARPRRLQGILIEVFTVTSHYAYYT